MKEKLRDSNMELMRIVAMLLVMIIHADFKVLGNPSHDMLVNAPTECFIRFFIGASASVCVNVFVMVSGWYGIKWSMSRLLKFLIQVAFFSVMLFIFLTDEWSLSICLNECKNILLMEDYWFVKAYIILFLVAPALNSFAVSATKKQFKTILIVLIIVQTILSYIGNSPWYSDGYSPLPFFTLYLLARYIWMYPCRLTTLKKETDMVIYVLISLVIVCISMILLAHTNSGGRMFNYTSPLVILISVFFFLFFTKVKLQSKTINWIAKSSFAAYLVHMNSHFYNKIFASNIFSWYNDMAGFAAVFYIAVFILVIFLMSVFIDKIQIIFANALFKKKQTIRKV